MSRLSDSGPPLEIHVYIQYESSSSSWYLYSTTLLYVKEQFNCVQFFGIFSPDFLTRPHRGLIALSSRPQGLCWRKTHFSLFRTRIQLAESVVQIYHVFVLQMESLLAKK